MTALPAVLEFRKVRVEHDQPKRLKDGSYSIETVRHHWSPCDVCGEGTYIAEDDLKARWDCPECQRTSNRKVAVDQPVCTGRTLNKAKITHEPRKMTTTDPNPGKKCRMTPRCKGKHRRSNP